MLGKNLIVLLGDFNCGLHTDSTHVGRGVTKATTSAPDTSRLQQILRDNNLVALNTWRMAGRRAGTFQTYGGSRIQIDFIVMGCAQADSTARTAAPRADLPFVPADGMFHLPLFADLPLKVTYSFRTPPGQPGLTLARVQASLRQDPTLAQAFSERMTHQASTTSTLDDLNMCMLQTWQSLAPRSPPDVSDPQRSNTTVKIRASWQQRSLLRQRVQTISQQLCQHSHSDTKSLLASLFEYWRLQSTYRRMAKDCSCTAKRADNRR